MKITPIFIALALPLTLCSCSMFHGDFSSDAERNISGVEIQVAESKTMSGLQQIEEALREYYKEQNRIPATLNELVPKYMAEIPTVELGLSAHRDTNKVTVYPPSLLRDSVIDGTQIKDTGGWGYVYNDHQIIVFVDCTHQSSNGIPWYRRQTTETAAPPSDSDSDQE